MLQCDSNTNHTQTATNKSSNSSAKFSADKSASANKASGRWSKEEHQKFIEGLKLYGKNWKLVEDHVGTRNGAQIRSHAQKFFIRLEREFNLKFEDLNLQADKKKFEETLRKMSESPGDTLSSYKDEEVPEIKLSDKIQKELSPIPEVPHKYEALTQNSLQTCALSQSNSSPKLDHFEYPTFNRRAARKMSEDILHTKSHSLFDVIMSKIKACNNRVISPRLSDLVEISSSSRKSSFDVTNSFKPVSTIKPPLVANEIPLNSSFRVHSRKMSEDNVLINMKLNQLRRPEENNISDMELLTKKFKVN